MASLVDSIIVWRRLDAQMMSIAIANETAIGALRRTPLCTRQRVLGEMDESRDGGKRV